MPHTHVQCTLTVLADTHEVRIVDGVHVLACHPRSYDKGAQIERPAHIQALADRKHAARQHRATNRLVQAAPASVDLLVRAAERGANLGAITVGLQRLLERYGAASCRPPSWMLWRATCRTPMRSAWHWNVAANSAAKHRRSPSQCPSMCRLAMCPCSHMISISMTGSRI